MTEEENNDLACAARVPHTPRGDTARFGAVEVPVDMLSDDDRIALQESLSQALDGIGEIKPDSAQLPSS